MFQISFNQRQYATIAGTLFEEIVKMRRKLNVNSTFENPHSFSSKAKIKHIIGLDLNVENFKEWTVETF